MDMLDALQLDQLDEEVKYRFGASLAADVLSSSVQQKLNGIMSSGVKVSNGLDFDDNPEDILVDLESSNISIRLEDYSKYQNMIEQVTLLDGWSSLENEFASYDSDSEESVTAAYISQYMRDYFRNGKIIKLSIDGKKLKSEWSGKLKGLLPGLPDESTYEEVAEKLLSELGLTDDSSFVWGNISEQGFVTRGGVKSQFPAIVSTYDLATRKSETTKIEFSAVGTDLVRVLLQ